MAWKLNGTSKRKLNFSGKKSEKDFGDCDKEFQGDK